MKLLKFIKNGISGFKYKINTIISNQDLTIELLKEIKLLLQGTKWDESIYTVNVDLQNVKSEKGQDLFVSKYFKDKKNGIYVDIGAYDGIRFNNTYLLERALLWTGLLIEPNSTIITDLQKNRNTNTNKIIQCALGSMDTEAYIVDREIDSYIIQSRDPKLPCEKISVQRFDTLIHKNNISKIDYLSINIGGKELELLQSIDLTMIPIGLVSINNKDEKNILLIDDLMQKYGYSLVIRIANDFFYHRAKQA